MMAVTEIWLIRHGESVANVAATAAELAGLEVIDVEERDADVPLSPVGWQQAEAFGDWLGAIEIDQRPALAWCSPYFRARQTVDIAVERYGLELPVRVDERLRDRELGVLDLLTSLGVAEGFPSEDARRRRLGKFYYRPPGGESWADVALRVRSVLRDIDTPDAASRVLVAAHDAIVMSFVYVCTGWSEARLLDFAQHNTVANASVTRLTRAAGDEFWTLAEFAASEHLEAAGAPVTLHEGDRDVQPR